MKKTKMRSFASRLSRWLLFIIFLTMAAISYFVFVVSAEFMSATSSERYADAMSITGEKVEKMLMTVEIVAVNSVKEVEASLSSPQNVMAALQRELPKNQYVIGCFAAFEPYYFRGQGRWYEPYVIRRDSIHDEQMQLGSPKHDYLSFPWYQNALTAEKGVWTEPYFDDTGTNMMLCTFCLPICDASGHKVGVFGADVPLSWLAQHLKQIDKKNNVHILPLKDVEDMEDKDLTHLRYWMAYSFLVGSNGEYILHPDSTRILTRNFYEELEARHDSIASHICDEMRSGKGGSEKLEIDSINCSIFYSPLPGHAGWSMAIVVPQRLIDIWGWVLGGILLLFIALGMILVCIVCYIIVHRSTKPLKMLSTSADEVARGNFHADLPVIKHNDEIHALRDSFEKMQISLADYIKQLTEATTQRVSMESELKIAHNIQMSMIPKDFPYSPERKDLDIFGSIVPAKAVGGDLFDFSLFDDHLFFCIGDVSGKGVPASLIMAVTSAQLRSLAAHSREPHTIIEALNTAEVNRNESNMFVTLFVGMLDMRTGVLKYANAGHDAPFLIEPDGQVKTLPCESNLPIAVMEEWHYIPQQITLAPGTTIFLYTDGLTEAETSTNAQFGEERIVDVLKANTQKAPNELVEAMGNAVHAFVGNAEQSDDLTMLAIRYQKLSVCLLFVIKIACFCDIL